VPPECALGVLVDNPDERDEAPAEVAFQIGFELNIDSRSEGLLAVFTDIQSAPDDAAHTVRANQYCAATVWLLTSGINIFSGHRIIIDGNTDNLRVEADGDIVELLGRFREQRSNSADRRSSDAPARAFQTGDVPSGLSSWRFRRTRLPFNRVRQAMVMPSRPSPPSGLGSARPPQLPEDLHGPSVTRSLSDNGRTRRAAPVPAPYSGATENEAALKPTGSPTISTSVHYSFHISSTNPKSSTTGESRSA